MLISIINAIKSVGKSIINLKKTGKYMKTSMMKILAKAKPVWNMGGLKQTHRRTKRTL
jgi:hypothetical protein